jgi:anti-sigma regulatory factor (Ser/Thr protein kinase)
MSHDEALLTLDLPRRAGAAAAARKALTALNGSLHLVSPARLDDAQLLVSELITNALRHGGRADDKIHMVVRADPQTMRVEVSDFGSGFDPGQLPGASAGRPGGWGLPIVASLAHRWGVERGEAMTIWFEIDRPQRDTPLTPDASPPL